MRLGYDRDMTTLECLLDAWRFMDGLICTGGRADQRDATEVLSLAGAVETMQTDASVVVYVDTGEPLDSTIWWKSSTRLFYFGVVGDEEGSLSQ